MIDKRTVSYLLGLFVFAASCFAQGKALHESAISEEALPHSPASRLEELTLLGADVQLPPFQDSRLGADSAFRRTLLRHGMAFRLDVSPSYSQNLLSPPVPADQQVYVGERPLEKVGVSPILTMDLGRLHLRGTQLWVSGAIQWVSWNPDGPRGTTVGGLYLYKTLGEGRIEMKAGYLTNNYEFVGLYVGGSLASGSLGVYAVLPFEVGLSCYTLTTPSFNLKWNGPRNFYLKSGLQRSTDAAGGPATVARNRTALRFIPKGDKLLTIFEAGYNRPSATSVHEMWLRGGYMRNATRFSNSLTGGMTSGNYCAFLLGDLQLTRGSAPQANSGVYLGASAMMAPADMNVYTQYYEARVYMEGPFRKRPSDTASFVASRSIYSRDSLRNLIAEGKSVWRSSNSLSGSYTLHVTHGVYMIGGLSYITGPAITPRVSNAFTVSFQSNLYF